MKKLYFVSVASLLAAGVFVVLKFGLKPQPMSLIKPSSFSNPHEIGTALYRQIQNELDNRNEVFFGVPPLSEPHREILKGFMMAAAAENRHFETIIAEEQMPALALEGIPPVNVITLPTNTKTQANLIGELGRLRHEKKRTLIYTASVFSTKLLERNPIRRLEKTTGEELLAITSVPLALEPKQEFIVDPPCVGEERDMMGTSDLGCAILLASRRLYGHKFESNQYVSTLQQNGSNLDFLLLTYLPKQEADAEKKNFELRMNVPDGLLGSGKSLPQ